MKSTVKKAEFLVHPIPPFFDRDARVLVLGSFPSVKSRESGFFYGHPRNRFWTMIAAECNTEVPVSIPQKKEFLREHHIAMWDTIRSCTITGSSDSSIRDVVPNDLNRILEAAPIRNIYCNGTTSYNLYMKYIYPQTGRAALKMPSTSPANAAWTLEKLIDAWRIIRKDLKIEGRDCRIQ
ncbi:MAG: DNA-deoxyinosine glycosylase [Bilifractor sp.]